VFNIDAGEPLLGLVRAKMRGETLANAIATHVSTAPTLATMATMRSFTTTATTAFDGCVRVRTCDMTCARSRWRAGVIYVAPNYLCWLSEHDGGSDDTRARVRLRWRDVDNIERRVSQSFLSFLDEYTLTLVAQVCFDTFELSVC
jgi:hypothetical protein